MNELKKQAINLAQDQNINYLLKKLDSYNLRESVGFCPEKDNLGQLRTALCYHINKLIGLSATDLQAFINHFQD